MPDNNLLNEIRKELRWNNIINILKEAFSMDLITADEYREALSDIGKKFQINALSDEK